MYEAAYSNQARKFLKSADKSLSKRFLKKIDELIEKPFIHDSKTVEGSKEKLFRVRVGDYRILYEIDYQENIIGIVKIDKRPRAY